MVISALIIILILVLKPSWITAVSELILLRISPVLFSSKKPTSLFIKKKNRSYLRFLEIASLMVFMRVALIEAQMAEIITTISIIIQ